MRYFTSGSALEKANPEKIRNQARQLTNVASSIDRTAGQLDKVSTRGVWESPAGDTFAAKVRGTPSDLFSIANRLRKTAEIIRPYAELLEASQRAQSDCDGDAYRAQTTMKNKSAELETMSPDDPDRARVKKERGQAAGELNRAERRFETVTTEAQADESRMAGKLNDVCDQVEDPVLYDYLEWMTTFGEDASTVGIIARPIALAGVTKPIGMAGLRGFYGEGSYAEVAKASAGYGLDTVSFGAGRVVKRAKQRFVDKEEVARVKGLTSNPVRIRDNPIIATGKARKTTSARGRSTSTYPKKDYAPLPSAVPASVRDITRRKTGLDDVKEAFDDWEMVAGEGRVAKVSVVVQHSAKSANRVRGNVSKTNRYLEGAGVKENTPERKEQREQNRRKAVNAERMTDDVADEPRNARVR